MTTYYRSTAIGDPGNTGSIKLSASMRRDFAKATFAYCLGSVAGKGVAYTTTPTEELGPVVIDTPAQMADRIGYLRQIPAVYDHRAKLAVVEAGNPHAISLQRFWAAQ